MAKATTGISVMRADLDAATSSTMDGHDAQRLAGVGRQAQPDAHDHQVAAGRASGAKRTAMPAAERDARRNEAKRARRRQLKEDAEIQEAVNAVVLTLVCRCARANWLLDLNALLARRDELPMDKVEEEAFIDFMMDRYDVVDEHGDLDVSAFDDPEEVEEMLMEWRDSREYQEMEMDQYRPSDASNASSDEGYVSDEGGEELASCRVGADDAGEPDDPDNPYGSPDMWYDSFDKRCPRSDLPQPLHVCARLQTVRYHPGRRNLVSLQLSVRQDDYDIDAYIDRCYAELESAQHMHSEERLRRMKAELPPRRIEYPLGEAGSAAYRRAREMWYSKRTGRPLVGTTEEQTALFFNATRDFRARGQIQIVHS